MKWRTYLFFPLWVACTTSMQAQSDAIQRASRLELQGRFSDAAAVLNQAIRRTEKSSPQWKDLEFELDRLERMRRDFPLTKEVLFAELKKSVKDLGPEEFENWVREGRFDSREIDGQRRYMVSSVSNLFFRYPELSNRRMPPKDGSGSDLAMWESSVRIRSAARAERQPYVLPKKFEVTMAVTAQAGAAPPGEIIRAWLPIPRQYRFQDGFEILSASPAIKQMDDEQSPIRCAYLEQPARAGKPTEFKITYTYTRRAVWFEIDPSAVKAFDGQDPALEPFLHEAPHIIFTLEIRSLAGRIAGNQSNPSQSEEVL